MTWGGGLCDSGPGRGFRPLLSTLRAPGRQRPVLPTLSTRGGAHRGQGCWELSSCSVLIRGDRQVLHSLVLVSLRGRDTPQFSQNSPWNSPGQNTGVGSLSLVQGMFPTPGSNPGLPHFRQIPYQLSHKGSPSHRTEVFISQNPKSLTLDWHHPAFSHWGCQEYLGGPAHAVGGKTALLGIMDDPQGILCT